MTKNQKIGIINIAPLAQALTIYINLPSIDGSDVFCLSGYSAEGGKSMYFANRFILGLTITWLVNFVLVLLAQNSKSIIAMIILGLILVYWNQYLLKYRDDMLEKLRVILFGLFIHTGKFPGDKLPNEIFNLEDKQLIEYTREVIYDKIFWEKYHDHVPTNEEVENNVLEARLGSNDFDISNFQPAPLTFIRKTLIDCIKFL